MSTSHDENKQSASESSSDQTTLSKENFDKKDYGYAEYPQRDKPKRKGYWSSVSEDTSAYEGVKCQMRVKQCFNESK